MTIALTFFGGPFNSTSINTIRINGVVRADFTPSISGYILSTGSAEVYSAHYAHPSGYVNASGFIIPAYGQLAVLGGYTTIADISTLCCWGHKYDASGYVQAVGSSVVYPMIAVQKMWTERTALVPSDEYREISILPYDNLVEVISTEERMLDVPAIETYYI
jgi:hypothetical protein